MGADRPRLAVISFHTSPMAVPGSRDAGGMNVYVRASAQALAHDGYALDLFTRQDGSGPPVEMLAEGVRLVRIPAGPARPLPKQALATLVPEFALGIARFRLDERLRYAVVHSHYWLSGLAGMRLARRWDVPHIAMFHTLGAVKNRARLGEAEPPARIVGERAVACAADSIVCATAHEQGLLRRLYSIATERTVVIPCGVDTGLFRPRNRAAARAQLALPADGRIILYVGRIEPLKGLDVAVDALARLGEPAPLLLVVGGDEAAQPEIARLRALATARGVAEHVRFVPAVPQQHLPLYYAAADVCIVPSYYESFGMAALEAQACGRPVVASRVGGLTDVVRDGVTGYLVPWHCPEPFTERLDLLLRNNALRERMGQSARDHAARFAWPAIARRLEALYTDVIERRERELCHPDDRFAAHEMCHVA